jgi:hypothetical protein
MNAAGILQYAYIHSGITTIIQEIQKLREYRIRRREIITAEQIRLQ